MSLVQLKRHLSSSLTEHWLSEKSSVSSAESARFGVRDPLGGVIHQDRCIWYRGHRRVSATVGDGLLLRHHQTILSSVSVAKILFDQRACGEIH